MILTHRLSSSIAVVILTLSKMILNVFAASNDNGNNSTINNNMTIHQQHTTLGHYDEHLFGCEDFFDILKDIWQIFFNSVTGTSFKVKIK